MKGQIPIPIAVFSLREAIKYGRHNNGAKVEIKCHRCGSTTKERYSAMDTTTLDTNEISLECIDCLVEVAIGADIKIDQVTDFIDNRYIGCHEACSYIQGLYKL